jgi:arylformamidase
MTLYDATLSLKRDMLTFPGDPSFEMKPLFQQGRGSEFNLSLICMGTHQGTHVDPPVHFIDGAGSVDALPLEALVGPGIVLDMRGRRLIDRADLESSPMGENVRMLMKTDNGPKLLKSQFDEEYVSLTQEAALFLVERKVRLVGIDYLSVDRYIHEDGPVHKILLKAGVVIVECVNLLEVPAGPCRIYCLPLKIEGGDGAPARVLVETDENPCKSMECSEGTQEETF